MVHDPDLAELAGISRTVDAEEVSWPANRRLTSIARMAAQAIRHRVPSGDAGYDAAKAPEAKTQIHGGA